MSSDERPPMHFAVGDEVVLTSVNRHFAARRRVVAVGRRLVRIDNDNKPYRISDGARNDGYGHEQIRPLAVWEWDQAVEDARLYFLDHGLSTIGRFDRAWLLRAAKTLRDAGEPTR